MPPATSTKGTVALRRSIEAFLYQGRSPLLIRTAEHDILASPGDWILIDSDGDFWSGKAASVVATGNEEASRPAPAFMQGQPDPAKDLDEALSKADALIRQRLKERRIEFPHLVVAMIPGEGKVIWHSNVGPEGLLSFAEDLRNVARDHKMPPVANDTKG